jgi:hypothetical protein
MDIDALPWQGDWYRGKAREALGDRLDDNFRLWYTDRANHSDGDLVDPTQNVSYLGVLQQALRDLSAWVETGAPPPQTTHYKIVDGQIVVPATAAKRGGVQPVADLKANGVRRAEVRVGQAVRFSAVVDVPPGTGRLVAAQWAFDGDASYPASSVLPKAAGARTTLKTTHVFTKPGTYFTTLRVVSQRDGDAATPYARIQNLARVRVVVK